MTKLLFSFLFRLLFTSRIPPFLSDSLSRSSWGSGVCGAENVKDVEEGSVEGPFCY